MSLLDHFQVLVVLYAFLIFSVESRKTQLQNNNDDESSDSGGKRWAVLIGSKGYEKYRHQADICHAYQMLHKGGLKDENIIVFMYDDIALSSMNPRRGVIVNSPDGDDAYNGVPKDYTGETVNVNNFFSVLLGNEDGINGGTGKVVNSGPNDNIYSFTMLTMDFLEMPTGEALFAKDFIYLLENMHTLKRYNKMVIYVEACYSGSMFEGILKNNLNIYAMTAAHSIETTWATYCPGDLYPPHRHDYGVCLGDVFSISWLQDSDHNDMRTETLEQQYLVAKLRTSMGNGEVSRASHVSRFGTGTFRQDYLVSYFGTNPENKKSTFTEFTSSPISNSSLVNQCGGTPLLYLQRNIQKAPMDSPQRQEAEKKLFDEMNHRKQIDQSIIEILRLSLKQTNVLNLLTSTRTTGQSLVDDWDCFKTLINSFKNYCGATVEYGLKYTGALANICNMGVDVKHTVSSIKQACSIK